jgi:hypothetical protein
MGIESMWDGCIKYGYDLLDSRNGKISHRVR